MLTGNYLRNTDTTQVFQSAHGYVELLSVVTVHFVQSFCQCGVNNQLATSPELGRGLFSLSSLLFAFHYIRQNLEIQHNKPSLRARCISLFASLLFVRHGRLTRPNR